MKSSYIINTALGAIAALLAFACNLTEPEFDTIKLFSADPDVVLEDESHATVNLSATGSEATLTIENATIWEIFHDAEEQWYKTEINENDITLSTEEFISDKYSRKSVIRIKGEHNDWAYITLCQEGSESASIRLDADSASFPEWGGEMRVKVISNKEWTVSGYENAEWLTVTTEGDEVVLKTATNNDPEQKNVTLVFSNGNEANHTSTVLPVKQAPWTEAYLQIPQTEAVVPQEGGANFTLLLTSNRPLEATSDVAWANATIKSGTLVVTTTAAPSENATATITVATPDKEPCTVSLNITTYSDPMILGYSIKDDIKISVPVMSPANVYIDWGDGSGDVMYASGSGAFTRPDHKYAEQGEYKVRIYGTTSALMTGLSCNWASCLTSLESWGAIGKDLTNISYGFNGTNIKRLPANTPEIFRNITNFQSAFQSSALEELPSKLFEGCKVRVLNATFRGCPNLKTIPADLFYGAEILTGLTGLFMQSGLESIPEGLLDPLVNLNRAINLFAECTELKNIPKGLFDKNPKLDEATGVFRSTAISEIPEGLFDNCTMLTNIFQSFYDCPYLKEIPASLLANCTMLKNISGLFSYCSGLDSIPDGLLANCTVIENVQELFYGCTALKTVPVSLFDNCLNLNNVTGLFYGCSSLTGESPYTIIDGNKVHLYERNDHFQAPFKKWIGQYRTAFFGCTKLDDYESIPEDWKSKN